tara:strand:- start:29361 stop:30425 length:1065 start_codon:yes stop_codon:yes gene_type:complete
MFENLALLIAALVYFQGYSRSSHFKNAGVIVWILFYGYAFIVSIVGFDPVLGFHMALRGVGYVFVGLLAGELISRSEDPEKAFMKYVGLCFLGMLFVSIAETITTISLEYLIHFGLGGSYVAIFGLVYMYMLVKHNNHFFRMRSIGVFIVVPLILYIVIQLNSLASILAFSSSLLLYSIFYNRILLLLLTVPILISVYIMIPQLVSGDLMIANKSFETIVSGSGRFQAWEVCWDKFSRLEVPFLGFGFLSDGVVLRGLEGTLSLVHSCHSSVLSNAVGLGYLGLIIYIIFVMVHLLRVFELKGSGRQDAIILFVSFLIFGVGSNLYPGSPTLLISLSVAMFVYDFRNVGQLKQI